MYLKERYNWGGKHYYAFYTIVMKIILCTIFVVFVAMLSREIFKWIIGNINIKKSILIRISVDEDVMEIVEQLKRKLKIRRKFKVYRAIGIGSPFIYGFFRPSIYITADKLSKEDLEVTLTHELCHYKQRDNYFKPLVGIMCCINWFNPLAWYIKEQYKIWAEGGCDYKCVTIGGYDTDDYFDCLIRTSNTIFDSFAGFISMSSSKSQIYDRAVIAGNYSGRKIKKSVLVGIAICSLFVCGITIYAVTDLAEDIFNFVFVESSEQFEDYTQLCEDGYIEHIEKIADEYYKEDYSQIIYNKDNNVIIEKDIPVSDEKYVLAEIKDLKGEGNIGLTITSDDDDSKLILGIIEPDGTRRYIEGIKLFGHTFEISKPGDYKVYIINENDREIYVKMSFLYWQDEED
ncbi:MAG: M56 family metallopeptidase [Lachnospiraceae bacterium]|nr:M56 family metallopeptidase [Lachnospiraceae bacterium]